MSNWPLFPPLAVKQNISAEKQKKALQHLTDPQQVNTRLSWCVTMDRSNKDMSVSYSRRQTLSCWFRLCHRHRGLHAWYHSHRCVRNVVVCVCVCARPSVLSTSLTRNVLSCCQHHHRYTGSHWCHTHIHTHKVINRKQTLAVPFIKSWAKQGFWPLQIINPHVMPFG